MAIVSPRLRLALLGVAAVAAAALMGGCPWGP